MILKYFTFSTISSLMVWRIIKDNDLTWYIILAATITSASYAGKICTLLIKIEEEHLKIFFIH